ncbi:MAG: prepilin-type N-terminal cleavage/methylation domain-containing protein [Phycisphaeraceae bacterium]|nr:prepilin-type N-terminal cleavage/methylation domain-containing protein [Phycisphaeraceae bacterium]
MTPCTPIAHHGSRHLAGYTLIEMVLSLALLSIIMVSAGSAMLFAAKAVPNDGDPLTQRTHDARLVARISEDLAQAKYVLEYTSQAVTIVVPDRDGDSIPDRIRYAWAGSSGGPLTYQFNDAAATTIAPSIDDFELTYLLENDSFTIPAPLIFGAEKLLSSYENDSGTTDRDVTATNAFSQGVLPILSAGSLGFLPTRLELYAKRDSPTDGVVAVELRDQTVTGPGADLYATATIDESDLTGGFKWSEVAIFPEQAYIPNFQVVAVSLTHNSGSSTAARFASNGQLVGGMMSSTDSGASWTGGLSDRLLYRLYGQQVFSGGSDITVAHDHVHSIQIELDSTGDNASPVRSSARMLQAPQILDAFWESDFDASPTLMDLDGDGAADWTHPSGSIPDSQLVKGVWKKKDVLSVSPTDRFTGPTVVELRMCAEDLSTAILTGPLHIDSSGDVLPITVTLRDDGGGNQELVFYNDLTQTRPYVTMPGLPAGWIDVEILVIPDMDAVALWVNEDLIGSVLLSRTASTGETGLALSGEKNDAKFSRVRITVGGTASQ